MLGAGCGGATPLNTRNGMSYSNWTTCSPNATQIVSLMLLQCIRVEQDRAMNIGTDKPEQKIFSPCMIIMKDTVVNCIKEKWLEERQ